MWKRPYQVVYSSTRAIELPQKDTYDGRAMKLRVLCLHGRCQTSGTFQRKLEKIAGKSASFAEFVPRG